MGVLPVSGVGVSFDVVGTPAPQGSKNPWGGEASKGLQPWRSAIGYQALHAFRAAGFEAPWMGPLSCDLTFSFPRPKAHYKKDETLRPNAPLFVAKKPDLDKLVRAVLDACTGVLYVDDAQVVSVFTTKVFSDTDIPPGLLARFQKVELL